MSLTALLDTGADRTVLNPAVARELFSLRVPSLESGKFAFGGAVFKAGLHSFSRLTFGGLTVDHPQIAIPLSIPLGVPINPGLSAYYNDDVSLWRSATIAPEVPAIVIGMDILKHTHLYVSFRTQRVYVSAAGDGSALKSAPAGITWFNQFPPTAIHPNE